MKGVAASVLIVLAIAHLMAEPGSAISCGDVNGALSPCIAYLTGQEPNPAAGCCAGVRSLKSMAATPDDRRFACNCIKAAAAQFQNLRDEYVSALPGRCGTPLPFPINLQVDCSRIG